MRVANVPLISLPEATDVLAFVRDIGRIFCTTLRPTSERQISQTQKGIIWGLGLRS